MEKIYTYKNATVYVKAPTKEQIDNIHVATERFLTKLVKEGYFNGNSNKTRSISKKSILD